MTSRVPSAIGGIVYLPPDAPRVRPPVPFGFVVVVRRVVVVFALVVAAVFVVVARLVGFFAGAFAPVDVRVRVVFAGGFAVIFSSGIAPLLCTFILYPRQSSITDAVVVKRRVINGNVQNAFSNPQSAQYVVGSRLRVRSSRKGPGPLRTPNLFLIAHCSPAVRPAS